VKLAWETNTRTTSSASRVAAKLKLLRSVLRRWAQGMAKLKLQLKHCNEVLLILDKLEENRSLYEDLRNFREILKNTY
jgi:chaperonin cofactor prefoldin